MLGALEGDQRGAELTGQVDTGWLDRMGDDRRDEPAPGAAIALVAAAVEAYDAETAVRKAIFLASAARGRPELAGGAGDAIDLQYLGHGYRLAVARNFYRQGRVDPFD